MQDPHLNIEVNISAQVLYLRYDQEIIKKYAVSTAKNGPGEARNSECTPRGLHIIRAKIGASACANTVFVGRRPSGEIYDVALSAKFPQRDWILTRILWLSGLEIGKNRLGLVDTMRRYIYIHGTPDEVALGTPGSRGCVRMHNKDIIELFELVSPGVQVLLHE